jgi:hypothetical protein
MWIIDFFKVTLTDAFNAVTAKLEELHLSVLTFIGSIPIIGSLVKTDEQELAEQLVEKEERRKTLQSEIIREQQEYDVLDKQAKELRSTSGPNKLFKTEGQVVATNMEGKVSDKQARLEILNQKLLKLNNEIIELDASKQATIEKRMFGGPITPKKWYSVGESGLEVFLDKNGSGNKLQLLGTGGPELFKSSVAGDIYPITSFSDEAGFARVTLSDKTSNDGFIGSFKKPTVTRGKSHNIDISGIVDKLDDISSNIIAFNLDNSSFIQAVSILRNFSSKLGCATPEKININPKHITAIPIQWVGFC